MAQIAQQSGQVLLGVVNDILDFSKIEAGMLAIERIESSPREILDEVVEILAPRAFQKGLELGARVDEGVPERVCVDPLRLRQVLLNLANNAIKFTERGHATIALKLTDREAGAASQSALLFEVTDTGIGIDDAASVRLFSPFAQADGSMSRRFGGTGLGLAIAKQLVELMGGEIGVRSVAGVGSCFWFSLPFSAARAAVAARHAPVAAPSPDDDSTGRGLVLVAEDNPVNREVVLAHLRSLGVASEAVSNGREAVAAWQGGNYSMVLMDCQMPEMDGFEATSAIRELEAAVAGEQHRTPIVALTANAMTGDRERCIEAGMDDYLSKPFARDELRRVVLRWLAAEEQELKPS
jgi:CheY-like chemotaxis protein